MKPNPVLSPREAEAVIEEKIEQFGLGVLPRIEVTALPDGNWQVRWENVEHIVAPMTGDEWHAWVEENAGSLDPGDLATTES